MGIADHQKLTQFYHLFLAPNGNWHLSLRQAALVSHVLPIPYDHHFFFITIRFVLDYSDKNPAQPFSEGGKNNKNDKKGH